MKTIMTLIAPLAFFAASDTGGGVAAPARRRKIKVSTAKKAGIKAGPSDADIKAFLEAHPTGESKSEIDADAKAYISDPGSRAFAVAVMAEYAKPGSTGNDDAALFAQMLDGGDVTHDSDTEGDTDSDGSGLDDGDLSDDDLEGLLDNIFGPEPVGKGK